MNGLSKNLKNESILFVDDTSLFSVVHDINTASDLNYDLEIINHWAFQRKMNFNRVLNKQTNKNKKLYSI